MKTCLAALALLAAIPMAAGAGDVSAIFTVSTTVPARASIETVSQPRVLSVSAEDVARGYVDVPGRYHVSHNDRSGYLLQFAPLGGIAREVQVRGVGGAWSLGGGTVEVYRPGDSFEQDVALEFRFVLAEGTRPGTFGWPLELSVQPN